MSSASAPRRRLRVAMLAPPWLSVPPPGYGGIESVVALLCEGLVERGHNLTLFAAPGSRSSATVCEVLPACYPNRIERALHEADHVARVFDAVDKAARAGQPFDVIHDHCGFTAFAMANRIATPLLHTLHGPFTAETTDFYRHHAANAPAVSISVSQRAQAPLELDIIAVIPNPTDVRAWPYRETKKNYVLWVGRMCEEKGPHRAIAAAHIAGVPLILAGPIQAGQEPFFLDQVASHIDGERVTYVGEIGGDTKLDLFTGARGLLMPILWSEPFGMVMIEALSAGTPVIAFANGAAPEIVDDGITGYLVTDEADMATKIALLDKIDPAACRHRATRFDIHHVAREYETAYYATIDERHQALG